jgi:methanogenic corrinoid protein MtbC1
MDELYTHFKSLLDKEDREGAVNYVIGLLQKEEVDIITLYEQIIGPAINEMTCSIDGKWCIWKEHVRTSIAATVLGCCFPFVMKERRERQAGERGKVIIACPPEEYHEIGARMVADLFTLCGHEVTFIGANTPNLEVATAVELMSPRYLAISVSNSFNLFAAERTISSVRRSVNGKHLTIIVGGSAFERNPNAWREIGADRLARTYADIAGLEEG